MEIKENWLVEKTTLEAIQEIDKAKKLVAGKTKLKGTGTVHLNIIVRHNYCTTEINLVTDDFLRQAYYCGGKFWTLPDRTEAILL
jgi:hypothetical protein